MDQTILESEKSSSELIESDLVVSTDTDKQINFAPIKPDIGLMENIENMEENQNNKFHSSRDKNLDNDKSEKEATEPHKFDQKKKDTDSDEDRKKIANSITAVSEFSDTKIESQDQIEMYEQKINLSFSSSSSDLQSPNQNSVTKFSANHNHHSLDNSSDVVPRKNSPIPTSPPSNIDLANESSSIEHLSSLNNLDSNSGFKRVKSDRSSKVSESSYLSYRLSRNHSSKNKIKVDAKNEKITQCLDRWYKELKGQVMSEFEKSKAQVYFEQEKKISEEREKQNNEVIKLRREIELLRETVKLNEKNLLKKDTAIENITKAFEKQREKNDLQRVMMDWKFKRLENAKEAFTSKLAEKYYYHRLKMKMFFNWQCFLISKHRAKVEKACKKKAEEVCYDLATSYENRIKKIEEDLRVSRSEVERYRMEMAKNEENMRKALMRGVCALNMEAMSIFNENQVPFNQILTDTQLGGDISKTNVFVPNLKTACSLTDLSMNRKYQDEKDLARKVKSYCDTNLSTKNKSSDCNVLSAVAKARLQLLNSNSKHSNETNPKVEHPTDNESSGPSTQKLCSNNKIFDELTEHNLMITKKIGNKHSNIKSKIGSLPKSNSTGNSSQLGSTLPPYRSVVIEKHTKSQLSNDDSSVKMMTTKVKYSPPGQPANVLNTVITT